MLQRKVIGTDHGTGLKVVQIDICGDKGGGHYAVARLHFQLPGFSDEVTDTMSVSVHVPDVTKDMTLDQVGDKALEIGEAIVWIVAGTHNLDTAQNHWLPGVGAYRSVAA